MIYCFSGLIFSGLSESNTFFSFSRLLSSPPSHSAFFKLPENTPVRTLPHFDVLPLAEPGCEALDRKRRPTPLPQAVCKEGLKLPGRTATDARRVRFLRPHK